MTGGQPASGAQSALPALVADVGGTNTRIALARGTRLQPRSLRRYLNCRFASLEAVIARYLQEHRVSALAGGCVAVAGPVACGRGNITHLNWDVDTDSLAGALGIPRFSIINDLQAVGHALQLMRPEEIQTIVTGRAADPSAARLVINVGTGFNAAAVHTSAAGRVIPPSECGHAGLPAAAIEDPGLKQRLQDTVWICDH